MNRLALGLTALLALGFGLTGCTAYDVATVETAVEQARVCEEGGGTLTWKERPGYYLCEFDQQAPTPEPDSPTYAECVGAIPMRADDVQGYLDAVSLLCGEAP